ncbi:DEAD/DEAH box helicase family protein [Achromobacter xylosoxidans]|jgi:hypothetical protein|nr:MULTISPECIES: DEAD/DEAH box helicase family protein [Achromobacter]
MLALKPISSPNSGFRPGQLGALHSVAAHFSVYDEPAIVSLPTGYGKTAVIMALPFLLCSNRVLVVEPTDVLRRQTSAHFGELSTLRKLKVLPAEAGNPHVHPQKGRPLSADEWLAFKTFDVVVSTPASTSPVLEPVSPADLFDLIIFDEAHHAPADTFGFMVGRTFHGGARMRYRGATRLARSRGEEQSRLWQGLPYLLPGGIHQPELSPDVGGLGSERGTVVPGKVAYRTFLHVGTVRRDHSLRWQQSAYVGDFLGEFRNLRRVSARKTGLDPLSGDLRHSPRGLSQAFCLWRIDFVSQLQTGPLVVRHGALARGDLSLSGTLRAWSGIGHAATPNTLGCMASAGLDWVGDRPISTHYGHSSAACQDRQV